MKISELLTYKYNEENAAWWMFEELDHFDFLSKFNLEFDNTKVRSYVDDQCWDQRSRDIRVLEYKGEPFFFYQYVGKGYVKNERIINSVVMIEFIKYHMEKALNYYFLHNDSDEVNIETYGAKMSISDGQIIMNID